VIGVSVRKLRKLNLLSAEYILKEGEKATLNKIRNKCRAIYFFEKEATNRIRLAILEIFNNLNLKLKSIDLPSNALRKYRCDINLIIPHFHFYSCLDNSLNYALKVFKR